MFLSDKDIKEHIKSGKIVIEPECEDCHVRTAGVRVHLGAKILVPKPGQLIDLQNPVNPEYEEHNLEEESFTISPGDFILATTLEKVSLDRSLLAFIDGRSTIARLGLTVHLSSTTIENYAEPRATTLEMKNEGNFSIVLRYKDPVGMLTFAKLRGSVEQNPQSQYANQDCVAAPNIEFQDRKRYLA